MWIAYGFMLPAAILVAVLMYWPMLDTFRESLYASSFINPNPKFVGFETYGKIFADPLFWQILRNSVRWTSASSSSRTSVGFFIALLLNQQPSRPGRAALADPAALGAARRRGRHPVALHV